MDGEAINRLLVVDDEAAQVEALCRTLEDEGYTIKGFTATSAALEALRSGSFDIVLTDLTMPGMDGIAPQCCTGDRSRHRGHRHDRSRHHRDGRGGDEGRCTRLHP